MTDNNHPITPPPELVDQWRAIPEYADISEKLFSISITTNKLRDIATQAARWGADQELEACCEWTRDSDGYDAALGLRADRRPKPQSQAEKALIALEQIVTLLMPVTGHKKIERFDTIRAALKRLRELERTVAD